MKQVLILGGGIAGCAAATAAAQESSRRAADGLSVTLVAHASLCSIQVRNYQGELKLMQLPLEDLLRPLGVRCVVAEIADIDFAQREVKLRANPGATTLTYDVLVVALGEHALDVSALAALGKREGDRSGGLRVDAYLRVAGIENVFATRSAPESAAASGADAREITGRIAGDNAVRALSGRPLRRTAAAGLPSRDAVAAHGQPAVQLG